MINGEANASAVGTLVERTRRLLMFVKLRDPKPASAANVLQSFTDKLVSIAQPLRQTLIYNHGREMALHKQLTEHRYGLELLRPPIARGKGGATKTRMALIDSTSQRARTCRFTAKTSWTRLQIRSTIDRAMD